MSALMLIGFGAGLLVRHIAGMLIRAWAAAVGYRPLPPTQGNPEMIDSPIPYVQVVVSEGNDRPTRLGLLRGRMTRSEGKATHAEVDVMTTTDGGGLVFSGRTTLVPIQDVEALGPAALAVFADVGPTLRA